MTTIEEMLEDRVTTKRTELHIDGRAFTFEQIIAEFMGSEVLLFPEGKGTITQVYGGVSAGTQSLTLTMLSSSPLVS